MIRWNRVFRVMAPFAIFVAIVRAIAPRRLGRPARPRPVEEAP